LAHFLHAVHAIEFRIPGYIEFGGDPDMPFALDLQDYLPGGDSHPCQKPENLKKYALEMLASRIPRLPMGTVADLRCLFDDIPSIVEADYHPPHFVINNYHPFHFHVTRDGSGWQVSGLYDFEAASSGCSTFDLALNDLQLVPILGGAGWLESFYRAYGRQPALGTYKVILMCSLLMGIGEEPSEAVPDAGWLIRQLPTLIQASRWDEFRWYPE
jgi:hypothetical protein